MVDLSIIKPYIINISDFFKEYIPKEIESKGISEYFAYNFKTLNCIRTDSDGNRLIQTINYTYKSGISEVIYAIENFVEDEKEKDKYYTALIELHKSNLDYEEFNPPIIYSKKKTIKKTINKSENKEEKNN